MKMKELKFNDVYEVAELIKTIKFEISEEDLEKLGNDGVKAGIQLIKNVIGDIKESKTEMNKLLGYLFGITGDEFGELGMKDVASVLRQIAQYKKTPDFLDFLDAVSQLMSQKHKTYCLNVITTLIMSIAYHLNVGLIQYKERIPRMKKINYLILGWWIIHA